jgi:hypothetical protein
MCVSALRCDVIGDTCSVLLGLSSSQDPLEQFVAHHSDQQSNCQLQIRKLPLPRAFALYATISLITYYSYSKVSDAETILTLGFKALEARSS